MKKTIFIFTIFIINNLFSQNRLNGIILDYDTKKPIEYVDIYNNENFTSTNSEGKFLFISKNDSINIRLIGYESLKTAFNQIKNDTIFLKSKFNELDEIIVSNKNFLNKIRTNITQNYPFEPYTETFFLRCYIKKNGELLKIQDINGIVKRKTLFATKEKPMPKKNYEVNVLNVRKAGVYEEDIYFKMFNFKVILNELATVGVDKNLFYFNEQTSKNNDFTKYYFSPNSKNKANLKGYYLVNKNDNAFTEFHLKRIDTSNNYIEKRGIKYKTTNYSKTVFFKKNIDKNNYFIDKGKINAKVEVIDKNGEKIIYNAVYTLITLDQNNLKLNKKHSINKDIFKFKKPYDKEFWKEQEYLLLTEEMNTFLKKLKDSNKEFKTITNIK